MPGKNLRDSILDAFRSANGNPLSKSQLSRGLKLPGTRIAELRSTLDTLVKEGQLKEGKKNTYLLPSAPKDQLTGTLKFHPKGHAYFFPDLTDEQNLASGIDFTLHSRIFIDRRHTATSLDGDRVGVSIIKAVPRPFRTRSEFSSDEADEMKGRVVEIIERRSGKLVGTYRKKGGFGWIDCDDKAIEGRVDVIGDTTAMPGQLVVVVLEEWIDRNNDPRGRIVEVLGWPGDPGVDIISVIHRHGLRTSFPDAVLAEARAVPEAPEPEEIARRKDWRDKLVITIDPADAKDHDDAIWLKKHAKGWTLAVHIADVSHYIKPGSPMDQEAIERGNSTYLVDRVLPMLPTELSNGICSLKPDVDRLTKCALLEISHGGEITRAKFIDAVIHSRAKLSYEQAQAILDGKPAPEGSDPQLAGLVKEGWNLASAMRKRRFENGALDLEMPEIKVRLDDQGRASTAEPVVHTESHQLVEECMLAANEAVAKILKVRMKPAIYRIHDDPDPSRLKDFTETAKQHGYRPGDLTNRDHIQKLLDESKGSPEEHVIKLGLLKSLKRAAYSAEPVGHYGLAKQDYCHFTSPIRRYADLIVHRALQPLLENAPKPHDRTPSFAELQEISRHISDTERKSSDAESETKQIKLMEYLDRVSKSDDPPLFDGLITDVRPMGLMVEIPDMGVRGVVKREDLPPGRWFFEAHRKAWVSTDGKVVQLGMRIPLRVTNIDFDKRFVDFAVAGRPTSEGTHVSIKTPAKKIAKKQGKPHTKPAGKAGPAVKRAEGRYANPGKPGKTDKSKKTKRPRRK
ncbi:ribonuclease R [Luteolibacter yonseiensis]|uniref:Ribonuclease R n=1 Tax=Luteolibacter yonseiensis TaxID=1144680 RepID=A0A934R6A0_9BACT|nr:ribonuclease R [Luteolibacter yonseiensis]MBK1816025.1 ribonuclease R [Luteolibacter yonseiensis]